MSLAMNDQRKVGDESCGRAFWFADYSRAVNGICSAMVSVYVMHRVKLARVTETGNLEEPYSPIHAEIQVLPALAIELI